MCKWKKKPDGEINHNSSPTLVKVLTERLPSLLICLTLKMSPPLYVSALSQSFISFICGLCLQVTMVNSRVEAPAVAVMGGGGATAGRSCAGCGGRIADRFLLFSMEQYWHTRCLKCSCCHAQLGEFSSTCYSKGGMILCKNDYIRLEHICPNISIDM